MDIRNWSATLLLAWGLLVCVLLVALALAVTRRPYRPWLNSAGQLVMVWWCGAVMATYGLVSAPSFLIGFVVVFSVGERLVTGARATFGHASPRTPLSGFK